MTVFKIDLEKYLEDHIGDPVLGWAQGSPKDAIWNPGTIKSTKGIQEDRRNVIGPKWRV
jgi:hypothetical protein